MCIYFHKICWQNEVWEALLLGVGPQQADAGRNLVRWGGRAWKGLTLAPPLSPYPSLLIAWSHPSPGVWKAQPAPSILRSPPARPRRWAGSASPQPFWSSWASWWPAPQRVTTATRTVSPSSCLLYRPGGGKRGVLRRGWGAGVGRALPALTGFLLGNWAIFTPGTFHDSQKEKSLCFQLKKVSGITLPDQGPHL